MVIMQKSCCYSRVKEVILFSPDNKENMCTYNRLSDNNLKTPQSQQMTAVTKQAENGESAVSVFQKMYLCGFNSTPFALTKNRNNCFSVAGISSSTLLISSQPP